LESAKKYEENRRLWRSMDFDVAGPCRAVDGLAGQINGYRADALTEHTEWLVDGGQGQIWITLTDAVVGDPVYHRVSYEEARKVVLAFVDGVVIDRRKPQREIPGDPPLPIGRRARQITAVGGRNTGWNLDVNGWTFEVESEAGRLVVTDSSFPIP